MTMRAPISDLPLAFDGVSLRVKPARRVTTLLWDARFALVTTLLAGFGRAAAEVGTVMIVGGNIDGFTRTMTTTIALETSKGDLPLALGAARLPGHPVHPEGNDCRASVSGDADHRGTDPANDRGPVGGIS